MSYCLYCHASYLETWSWATLFGLDKRPILCQKCESKLELIKGDICRICSRSFSLFPEQYRQGDCCYDCIRWEEDKEWKGVLQQNRSFYVYNDFLKEVITKIKYRGDAELMKAFYLVMRSKLKGVFGDAILVPIPLSNERHYERGFNQADIIATGFNRDVHNLLKRNTHEEKQSKKNRHERMKKKDNPFSVINQEQIKGHSVLLIDDVYTTGSTLRYAAKVMLEKGAKSVSSITLGR
jgi:competence protein ComFC